MMDRYQRREALLETLKYLQAAFCAVEHINPRPVHMYDHITHGMDMAKEELEGIGCTAYYSEGFNQWMATYPPKGKE